ncbi:MAG TPA: head-tail adaptor protein [Thermomonas sp.]|nr:head-tail adaptor protein [Thermomonas sp.]
MQAQSLRHRITVESKTATVDPGTGYPTEGWANRVENEPAEWLAGPGREYLASEATRSAVDGRFRVRSSAATRAITAGDRVLWDGRTMEVKAPPLPDETARRWLILMVAETGTNGA